MPGGRVRVKGHFDKVTGEQLMTALSPLSKPTPGRNNVTGEPEPDPRTPAQRRADAISDIIRHYLDSGAAPGEGGERPHMTVFVDLRDLSTVTRNTNEDNRVSGTQDNAGHNDNGTCNGNRSANGNGNSSANGKANPADPDNPADTGNHPADDGNDCGTDSRCDHGDAEDRCHHDTADESQDINRSRPHRSSFLRRGPSWMPWLGPVTVTTAAMVSCDASITPIVMDLDGNPLDVGHTTRVIPKRMRKALDARDCGCAFPGCGRPAAWTDGHHIRHWSNNGETKLSNLVLLCRQHHTLIHKGDWQVFISTDDGHPWFIPPRWIDPDRQPVPAHNRRHLVFTG